MKPTVLIVGGAGVFGSRLAERLACSLECTIVIAGRSHIKATAAAQAMSSRRPGTTIKVLVLDRDQVTAEELRASGATIVVDAAGPFQHQPPRLAQVAIAAGCHFVDLADARDYVARFPELNEAALQANVLAVCGASSTPALSNAALDRLVEDVAIPETINIIISPGNRAPRGLSVVQAILSYVGQPVQIWEDGHWRMRAGWSLLHRRRLTGLPSRWCALCETPDLDIVPERFPTVRSAYFFAGLELSVLHCGLWALGLLVRSRLCRSLLRYAKLLTAVARRFERFGTDRGGMLVEILGWDKNGSRVSTRWGLTAEAGDGPYIPVMAALAMIRRLASGSETRRGARACVGLLNLEEITAEFAGLKITTYREVSRMESIFKRALPGTFDRMPTPIRELHQPGGVVTFKGIAQIDPAANSAGTVFARLFGFPHAARDVEVEVTIEPGTNREVWRRRFGKSGFVSTMRIEPGQDTLTEQFGLLRFALKVAAHEKGLDMAIDRGSLGPLPLPRFMVPWTRALERVDEAGRFTFDVEIGMLGIGRLVRYRGWLVRSVH